MLSYAELQATTNFSFLEGASHPHELIVRAAELGLSAIAITDRNSLAGIVRAHLAARELDVKLIVGCRLIFRDGSPDLLCYPKDRAAYGRLCRLLTVGKSDRVFKKKGNGASASWPPLRRPSRDTIHKPEFLKLDGRVKPGQNDGDHETEIPKGECHLWLEDFLAFSEGQIVAVAPPDDAFHTPAKTENFQQYLQDLARQLNGRVYLAASFRFHGDDAKRLHHLAALAKAARVPLIGTNDVLYHDPSRRRLQDILTCIRETCTIDEAGFRLNRNCRAASEKPMRNGAPVRGLPASDRKHDGTRKPLHFQPQGTYLRISRRDRAQWRSAPSAARTPDLGRAQAALPATFMAGWPAASCRGADQA